MGAWVNQQPQDEFFEYIAAASTDSSLKAALVEAREMGGRLVLQDLRAALSKAQEK